MRVAHFIEQKTINDSMNNDNVKCRKSIELNIQRHRKIIPIGITADVASPKTTMLHASYVHVKIIVVQSLKLMKQKSNAPYLVNHQRE